MTSTLIQGHQIDLNTIDFSPYVGLSAKGPCRVATTGNITLSGNQSIDGVNTSNGDRVLVKNQTAAQTNGIYVADAGVWSRAADFDGSPSIELTGAFTFITEGATNANKGFILSTPNSMLNPIILGTTPLTFVQFSGAGTGGTVFSVSAAPPPAGFTISGSPITTSGTLTFTLTNDLAAVEGLSTTGFVRRTGPDTWDTTTSIPASSLPGLFSGFGDPTSQVGLAATNGSATTAMRSDASPPLNQTIAPTWTGKHTFTLAGSGVDYPVTIQGNVPGVLFFHTDGAVDEKVWVNHVTPTAYSIYTASDTGTLGTAFLQATRTGTSISILNLNAGTGTTNATAGAFNILSPFASLRGTQPVFAVSDTSAPISNRAWGQGPVSTNTYSFRTLGDTFTAGSTWLAVTRTGTTIGTLTFGSGSALVVDSQANQNRAQAGTASIPSWSFTGATGTGLFLGAANSLSIASNSLERLRFDSSGSWLVGGTSAGTSGQVLTSNGPSLSPTWETPSPGSVGTVTSVAASQPSEGLTITGGPITSSGTLTFALANDLAALEGLGSSGFAVRTATDTWVTRTLIAGSGITISNPNGVAGNITISASGGTGSVTSVNVAGPGVGITASGGPITSTGTITLGLANDLAAVENLGTTGYVRRTATDTWSTTSTISGSDIAGNISGNSGGITGTLPVAQGGTGFTSLTTSNYIRAASATAFEQRTPSQVLGDIGALAASSYTAADVLAKLLTVDGTGSGIDADTVDSYHASNFLGFNGNPYYQASNWIQFNGAGAYGLYWPSSGSGTEIKPNTTSTYGAFDITGVRNSYAGFIFRSTANLVTFMSSGGATGVYNQAAGNGAALNSWQWYYDTGASVLNVTGSISASGNITAGGNVTASSDIRLKTNIQIIDNALEKVSAIRGITYDRTDIDLHQTGVIAQEVEKVLPEAVTTDKEGMKQVAYGNMVGLLIEAIKELKAEIDLLKKES